MPDTPLWKQLIHQDKLDRQYAVLLTNKDATHYEIAIRLARFAEANIFAPADNAVDAAHKTVATLRTEMLTLQQELERVAQGAADIAWQLEVAKRESGELQRQLAERGDPTVPEWAYSGLATIDVYGGGLLAMRLDGPEFPQGAPQSGVHDIALALRRRTASAPGQEKTGDELRHMVFGTEGEASA